MNGRITTKGVCSCCKTEIPKNSRSIMNHISKCREKPVSDNENFSSLMIILIEGKYDPAYWLVIKARHDITMKKIDKFLRDIWVECCGHLSGFSDSYSKIGMTKKLCDVFEKGRKISYTYDYGTTTEISLYLIGEIEDNVDREILVLLRNREIEYSCSHCGKRAVAICPYCVYSGEGLLCESCIESHECQEGGDKESFLPLVNSPRAGECGYCGHEEKYVKKYFPKEII